MNMSRLRVTEKTRESKKKEGERERQNKRTQKVRQLEVREGREGTQCQSGLEQLCMSR